MRIGVVGINYQHVALDVREAILALWKQKEAIHPGLSSVLLSTCHRVELYFSAQDPEHTAHQLCSLLAPWNPHSYTYVSNACFAHLVRVAAGWESLFLGETDIQRQVRDAYRLAADSQVLDPALHYLFQKALKLSKELRTRYPLPSLLMGEQVYQRATTWAGDLTHRKTLFLGFSRINRSIASLFLNKGVSTVTCCNRTPVSAPKDTRIRWLDWDHRHEWPTFDLVIVATTSPTYLLTAPTHSLSSHPRLLIDLSVPRNIDPSLSSHPHLTLWNIDQLALDHALPTHISLAELQNKVAHYISRFLDKHRSSTPNTIAFTSPLDTAWSHRSLLRKATETEMSISVQ